MVTSSRAHACMCLQSATEAAGNLLQKIRPLYLASHDTLH
jgi:hypothetical protein